MPERRELPPHLQVEGVERSVATWRELKPEAQAAVASTILPVIQLLHGVAVNPLARQGAPDPAPLPHSRACGIQPHDHGAACSSDCPTCGTQGLVRHG